MSTPTGASPEGHQGQDHQQPDAGVRPDQPAGRTETAPSGRTGGTAGTTTREAGTTPQGGTTSTRDVVRIVLHLLAMILVVLGISVDLDDRGGGLWGDTWTWAGFATLMALAQVAALLPRSAVSGAGWLVGAIGAGGLLLFWTLLMLPMISTNMAFLVTLGTACAVAGVLLSPDRRV